MTDHFANHWTRRNCLKAALLSPWALSAPMTRAQNAEQMRVGFIRRYQPFSFIAANNQLQGFDVDVVKNILAGINIEMVPVVDTLSRLRAMLFNGEIDFIGNQLLHTPENRRNFDFVMPYAAIQLVSVQHESDDRDFFSLDDMLGTKLGVLAGTGVAEQARGALGNAVIYFDRIDLALQALADKALDVVIEEDLIVEYHIEQLQLPIKVGAPMAEPIRVGMAVSKGQKKLQERLSSAVKAQLRGKSFRTISNNWFGYDVSRPRFGHSGI